MGGRLALHKGPQPRYTWAKQGGIGQMTALQQYQRLESTGLWRAAPDAQRRDVGVSFGDATLVISDAAGRPLAHWSLSAILRQNPGQRPAVFATDTDGLETLELDDPTMIEAIKTVQQALDRGRARPGRLRGLTTALIFAGLIAAGVFWLPGALRDQTVAVIPPVKRAEFGASILGHLHPRATNACQSERGRVAMSRLLIRLFGPDHGARVVVVPPSFDGAVALPGGLIALDQDLLIRAEEISVFAGHIVAANAARREADPLAPVLAGASLQDTVALLTRGDLADGVLADYAAQLAEGALPEVTDDNLRAAFSAANLPIEAWARAVGRDDLIDDDLAADAPALLSDQAWIAIKGLCDT